MHEHVVPHDDVEVKLASVNCTSESASALHESGSPQGCKVYRNQCPENLKPQNLKPESPKPIPQDETPKLKNAKA